MKNWRWCIMTSSVSSTFSAEIECLLKAEKLFCLFVKAWIHRGRRQWFLFSKFCINANYIYGSIKSPLTNLSALLQLPKSTLVGEAIKSQKGVKDSIFTVGLFWCFFSSFFCGRKKEEKLLPFLVLFMV